MPIETVLIILLLIAGFYMAWSIGANDVANAMGTSVGSGALTLTSAIVVAAILEFSGSFFFGSSVSETLQSGIIKAEAFEATPFLLAYGMLSALFATGLWLQLASYFGWPVSTTHAIVGGVFGFGLLAGGLEAVYWDNVLFIASSWVLSPVLGGIISYMIFNVIRYQIFFSENPVQEAKKMMPFFVFMVTLILTLALLLKGLSHFIPHLSIAKGIGISALISSLAAFISYMTLKKIEEESLISKPHPYSAEITGEVEKAKRHLKKALSASRGEMSFKVSNLIDQVDNLSEISKEQDEPTIRNKEYKMVEKIFGYLQIMSACLMAFAHGANDVANAIGPLSAGYAILSTGKIPTEPSVPGWQLFLGGIGIVVGLATWGWRVILTIGKKITELTPTRGFSAEFGAAATVLFATSLGLPISTTHTLVGSVVGVGLARGIEALNLGVTRDILISWIITIPISAAVTMGIYYLLSEIVSR